MVVADTNSETDGVARILGETRCSLAAAAKMVPGHGTKSPNVSTIFRWLRGIHTPVGIVRLEGVRVGGKRWVTSREAVLRFLKRLTDASLPSESPDSAPDSPRSPAERNRASAAASDELDKLGIK